MTMTALTRWRGSLFSPFEHFDWFGPPDIRVEQFTDNGRFTVRAEIPGVDPERDIEINVDNGMLRIEAKRTEERRDATFSEFRYGRMVRTLPLPAGTREETGKASYTNGILEVTFSVGEPVTKGRRIQIETARTT